MLKLFLSLAGVVATVAAAAESMAQSAPPGPPQSPPIPPNVEAQPVASEGGGYCYGGPHPVDTRHAAGPPWDDSHGRHTHNYGPFDLRLFALKDGCYYFVGDPQDFGYRGQTHSYYGAHPVQESYGGGWCFMIGGHGHFWQPWSPHFTVVGPWYYWQGPYDPFFWSYWPYYSFYYRSHYPNYYSDGRFYRGGGAGVAPPIRRVPQPTVGDSWRGNGRSGGGWGDRAARPSAAMPGNAPPSTPGGAWGREAGSGPRRDFGGGWRGGGFGSGTNSFGGPAQGGGPVRAAPAPSGGGGSRSPAPHVPGGSRRGWR